ncbi:unnamed protein product [Symbiodinium microadriaticum]|nr:unnamed protein product [Symbiodinium microadriaticum]
MIRALLASLCLFCLSALPVQAGEKSPVVVELFTSQGCSSCPPADRLLEELASQPHIIALSLPVTYWDYLGWTDKFAKPDHDQRQRRYAQIMDERRVYTPQMVIQGRDAIVGHRRAEANGSITKFAAAPATVAITLRQETPTLIEAQLTGQSAPATIWMVEFDRRQTVDIKRGENGGRRLTYVNVVSHMKKLGDWQGPRLDFRHELAAPLTPGKGCALIVQDDRNGHILGAAQLTL